MSVKQVARLDVDYTIDFKQENSDQDNIKEFIKGDPIYVFAGSSRALTPSYIAGVEQTFTRPSWANETTSLSDAYLMLTDGFDDALDGWDETSVAVQTLTSDQQQVLSINDRKEAGSPEQDTTTPPPAVPVPADCTSLPTTPPFNASLQLSTNFTYGNLTQGLAGTHFITGAKNHPTYGLLTPQQLLCNLKALCINVLEPLAAKYGRSKIQINSGYRNNGGKSQHEAGMAVDLRFLDLPFGTGTAAQRAYYNRAKEIKELFPYDQLLLEVFGNQGPWIHISYNSDNLRRSVRTFMSSTYSQPGLILVA